eukprot:3829064-Rhodomonas_salina.5
MPRCPLVASARDRARQRLCSALGEHAVICRAAGEVAGAVVALVVLVVVVLAPVVREQAGRHTRPSADARRALTELRKAE